ncbi:ABC transporter A family protein [Tieghemostelium lacteum]|uniref:ABC transporter A family protein n=1 Tax=Tieghemostelium lacteum TaxID=361077 RepID=A0A151Z5R2_TIELA|nr:ABC transporter A family protein [Tieghemostelium lacteum]|eukprot:KYQ89278.1 ABC transporter A family protein [Tieghemostelium lacteum]
MILSFILLIKDNYDEKPIIPLGFQLDTDKILLYSSVNGNAMTLEQIQVIEAMKIQVSILRGGLDNVTLDSYFKQFENQQSMELYFTNNSKTVLGGVWFENTEVSNVTNPFKYSVRVDADHVYNNDKVKDQGYDSMIYQKEGFSSIQASVDQAVLNIHGFNQSLNISTQIFPNPFTEPYQRWNNGRNAILKDAGSVFVTAAFFLFSFRLITELVQEKETKIREGMKMMGMSDFAYFVSWMTSSLTIAFPIMVLIFLIIRGTGLIYNTSFGVVFLLFFFYLLSLLVLSFVMSIFFDKSKFAGFLSYLVILLINVAGIFVGNTSKLPVGVKYFLSLFSPIAMACVNYTMAVKDLVDVIDVSPDADFLVDEWGIVGMLALDIVFYILLYIYLDNVVPTEFGSRRKWYFPVQPRYWFPSKYRATMDESLIEQNTNDIEMISYGTRKPTVSIRNLSKHFHTGDGLRKAVDKLSVDFYEDEIHSFLGHNGSGKSTTINMLTGLMEPTNGDALIFGNSIVNDIQEIRKNLGVCPQQDILYDKLTVLQHLRIFASLKGVPPHEIEYEANKYAKEVGLEEKKNAIAKSLSGGQKRKLCLAIAFIGGSKLIFIDEATSGLDPKSRREVWDFLLKYKQGKTIIFTTHFMDEADYLGDRIAILSNGKLRCDGSSLFLKKKFGVGYLLTCSKIPNACLTDGVTNFIKTYIPEASVLSDAGTELSYRLPTDSLNRFVEFFRHLEDIKMSLGVSNFGISVTTLEEVFLRLGKEHIDDPTDFKLNTNENFDQNTLNIAISTGSNGKKIWQQLKGLLIKRIRISIKDAKSFILTILLPLLLLICSVIIYKNPPAQANFFNVVTTPMLLSYQSMDDLTLPVSRANESLWTPPTPLPSYYQLIPGPELEDYLIDNFKNSSGALNFTLTEPVNPLLYNYKVLQNKHYLHTLPILINLVDDQLLKTHSGIGIQTTSQPFTHVKTPLEESFTNTNIAGIVYFAILFMAGYALMAASFAANVCIERVNNIKKLFYISGCNKVVYWLSNLLWDYSFALVTALIISGVLAGVDKVIFKPHFGLILLSVVLYSMAILPLAYLFSYKFLTFGKAMGSIFGIVFSISIAGFIGILNLRIQAISGQNDKLDLASDIFDYVFYVASPLYCLCKIMLFICEFTPIYPLGYYKIEDQWSLIFCGKPLFFLAGHFVIWTSLLLILDYIPQIKATFVNPVTKTTPMPDPDQDSDVAYERNRLINPSTPNPNSSFQMDHREDILVMKGLHKVFPKQGKNPAKVAIHNTNLGLQKGELFGLLGLNGSGKSTTLNILSGCLLPTSGSVTINGMDLITQRTKALESIGYCFQHDALISLLSAREQLYLYCRIKGIEEQKIPSVVEAFISMMDLTKYANTNSGSYSGGNKRKLSLSIALVANPQIVLLDEPSTGVDVQVKRFMWNVISQLSTNKVIILTTHSMDECEALATRLTIMREGKLKALGSVQQLKSKFGSGYSVDIKFKKEHIDQGCDQVLRSFPNAILLGRHDLVANFELNQHQGQALKISEIFEILQNQLSYLMDDYSVSQKSLEQIFLQLTKDTPPQTQIPNYGNTVINIQQPYSPQQIYSPMPPQSPSAFYVNPIPQNNISESFLNTQPQNNNINPNVSMENQNNSIIDINQVE